MKQCLRCSKILYKPYKYSQKQFEGQKFCGRICMGISFQKLKTPKISKRLGRPKGCLITQEHRNSISIALKGRKLSSTRMANHLAASPRGERHWNWQGGKTPKHKAFRRSHEYMMWRRHVFERDDYTCQGCRKRGVKLQADHELPFALYPDLRLEILNGRTLCLPCHKKTPSFGTRPQDQPTTEFWKELLANK